jgi:transporter family-2 protein
VPGRSENSRMQLIALGFFILAAGVASSVQAVVNAEVGRRTDPITAATVSFAVGLAVLLVVGAVSGRLQLAEATQLPPLLLTGGLFGVLIVTGFATVVPVLGVTESTLIYILGSLAAALAIDAFGLLGAQIPVTLTRIAGIVLAVVGFFLARR